jgi:hypothetical protein
LVVIDGEEETRADWSHSLPKSQVVVDVKQVHLTLKTTVQNRQQNRDRMKIDEKTIVKQISALLYQMFYLYCNQT